MLAAVIDAEETSLAVVQLFFCSNPVRLKPIAAGRVHI